MAAAALVCSCAFHRDRAAEERRVTAFNFFETGKTAEQDEDYRKALDAYRKAIDAEPDVDRPAFYARTGAVYQQLGELDRALTYYDKALELDPGYEMARLNKELLETQLAERRIPTPFAPSGVTKPPPKPVESTPTAEGASFRQAVFPELYAEDSTSQDRQRAREAAERGEWTTAALAWERVVDRDPASAEALAGLAQAYAQTGRLAEAERFYRVAVGLAEQPAPVLKDWGDALRRAGQIESAADKYRRAVAADPGFLPARNNLAACHVSLEEPREALDQLDLLLEEDPRFAPAHLNRALALASLPDRREEAVDALETYLRLDGRQEDLAERLLLRLREEAAASVRTP
mgnify:CR=1 FL=1